MAYEKELRIALLAVQRAALLTKAVFAEKSKGTISKSDSSPVTIGDYGAQALIISALHANFPSDEIVGEEEASTLRENAELRQQIWELVKATRLEDDEQGERELGGAVKSEQDMLKMIDLGTSAGGRQGRKWALDPIDGTKGFLRGGQYAVCLALIVDGDVQVGVLGCPNLPVDDTAELDASVAAAADAGVLLSAVKGEGASSRAMSAVVVVGGENGNSKSKKIHMRDLKDVSKARFCESVEAAHSSHSDQSRITEKLGITGESVRMDSQAKYASIARGAGDLYLRLPVKKDYEEKIWDHAAGDLIVRESGGEVTDAVGKRLDFGRGRTLKDNRGVVAAPKALHAEVLKVVMEVLGSKSEL